MAPDLLNSIDASELKSLALRIRDWQDARKLSDNAMLKRYAALGSTTTYTKILKGKLEELDLERQLENYRAVVALLESEKEDEAEEALYEDLVGPLEVKRAFLETSRTRSIARFVLVQGDTGTGKSACRKALIAKYGMRFVAVEATVAWGDRPRAMLAAILLAMGVKEIPVSEADCMLKVIGKLNDARRDLAVDEGHHLGPRCLNALKTIINQTPSAVIVFAMKTLWNRLERTAYEEVRQLTGNRLAERIKLELRERDIERILEGRLTIAKADVKKAALVLMEHAPQRGNLGFVREVCKRANELTDGGAVSFEQVVNAIATEKERR